MKRKYKLPSFREAAVAEIDVTIHRGVRVVRRKRSKYELRKLLNAITSESVQPTYNWGPDVGREVV